MIDYAAPHMPDVIESLARGHTSSDPTWDWQDLRQQAWVVILQRGTQLSSTPRQVVADALRMLTHSRAWMAPERVVYPLRWLAVVPPLLPRCSECDTHYEQTGRRVVCGEVCRRRRSWRIRQERQSLRRAS